LNRSSTACRGEREDKKKEQKKNIKAIVIKCPISKADLNRIAARIVAASWKN